VTCDRARPGVEGDAARIAQPEREDRGGRCLALEGRVVAWNRAVGIEPQDLAVERCGVLGSRREPTVAGRDPLSAYDDWVKSWKSRGGDQIRKEYQDALSSN